MYYPLWCKSNASLLEGASHPQELVTEAHAIGLPGLALTDRESLGGMVQAHVEARNLGLRLVVGAEAGILGEDGAPAGGIVLLAENGTGYKNLCRLLTRGFMRSSHRVEADDGAPMGTRTSGVRPEEIAEAAEGLQALWGTGRTPLLDDGPPDREGRLFRDAFGERLSILLPRHARDSDVPEEARLRERAARYQAPLVAATEVLYHRPGRRDLQDALTAIRHRTPLARAGRLLRPNAEYFLRAGANFAALFADHPAAVARSLEIGERCRFSLDDVRYRYPLEGDGDALRKRTFEGAARRWPEGVPEPVRRQLLKELELIEELDYGGYFLTMHEIVRFCEENRILCQGRGSAANSAVCYCLGITAVDPVRMRLLFERFLSRERAEPPDMDLDVMHARREEVIRFVYRKYGEDRAAMVANTVRYRTRSAVRDLGKALGFSAGAVDRLARRFSRDEPASDRSLQAAGWSPETPAVRHLIRLVGEIQGFPRHLSIHPGGFLLGREPVSTIVPVERAAMPGRTVIQWNKDDIEALGLFKVDLLALGALTQLDLAFRLLRESRGVDLDMASIPPNDPETFAMIREARTVGVFQIESRAQMSMLPRLGPENYYDLVIQISIVRPGPIAGGMVHPYLRRRRGEEPVEYPHPLLVPVLEKTLGVPLFQEQVMRLAVVAADYSPGEADQLRRDMAAWRRAGSIGGHRTRLISRMTARGVAREFAERIVQQIQGFGEYGFPESHAASFALISYAGAWILRHYPAESVCALLNAQPMGFYQPSTIIQDAGRRGVRFLPVDGNRSGWDCALEPFGKDAPAIRMGLRYVKGLGEAEAAKLLRARNEGRFASIEDLARRTGLGKKALAALAEADAFRGLGPKNRREAVWTALGAAGEAGESLLQEPAPRFAGLDSFESIAWDHRTTRHSVRGHPLEPLRGRLKADGLPTAREVAAMRSGNEVRYAGLVICRQRPGTASGVLFMTLEDETGFVNLILWPDVFERQRRLALTLSFLGVSGRIETERSSAGPEAGQGVTHVIVERLFRPEIAAPDIPSRDFQ